MLPCFKIGNNKCANAQMWDICLMDLFFYLTPSDYFDACPPFFVAYELWYSLILLSLPDAWSLYGHLFTFSSYHASNRTHKVNIWLERIYHESSIVYISPLIHSTCKQLKANLCHFVSNGFITVNNLLAFKKKKKNFFTCKLSINSIRGRKDKNWRLNHIIIFIWFDFFNINTPIMTVVMHRWINILSTRWLFDFVWQNGLLFLLEGIKEKKTNLAWKLMGLE